MTIETTPLPRSLAHAPVRYVPVPMPSGLRTIFVGELHLAEHTGHDMPCRHVLIESRRQPGHVHVIAVWQPNGRPFTEYQTEYPHDSPDDEAAAIAAVTLRNLKYAHSRFTFRYAHDPASGHWRQAAQQIEPRIVEGTALLARRGYKLTEESEQW